MSAIAVDVPSEEFEVFVQARTAPLLRAAYLLTGDQHLAEDLVQAALARTHRAWRRLDATAAADAYTRKTMYHLQVSWWRRRRVAETLTADLPAYAPSVADEAESTVLAMTLRSVLLRLPPRQRAVLALRFFEDLTEAQTADVLGVTVGTVKSQTAKALAKLRVLAPELREFYSGATDDVRPVDLRQGTLAASRALTTRTAAVSSAVAAALVAVLAATLILVGGRDGRQHPATTPSLTAAPSMTLLSSPAGSEPDYAGPLRGATVLVPAWRGAQGASCPSGQLTFDAFGAYQGANRQLWAGEWVESDVDGVPGDEIVVLMHCGEGPEAPGTEVLAFRRDGAGKLTALGRVVGAGDGFAMIHRLEAASPGVTVELSERYSDSGQHTVPFQRRVYQLMNGSFRQVAGPTAFPANPPAAKLVVRAGDLVFQPAADGRFTGRLTISVANTGTLGVGRPKVELEAPGWAKPAGAGWDGCTALPTATATSLSCPLSELAAGSTIALELAFVAETLPGDLIATPATRAGLRHSVRIGQLPPYSYEELSIDSEASFAIVRG